jgi:hypothetical protein
MLTVSIHSSLCVNENPTTHSMSVTLDSQCWRQNHSHHLNRPHLARLCVGSLIFVYESHGSMMFVCESPVHWCLSVSPMQLYVVWIETWPVWGRGCHGHELLFLHLVSSICSCSCCVSTLRCSTYDHMQRHSSSPNTNSSRTMTGCQTKPVSFHPWHLVWTFSPSSGGTCSYCVPWSLLRVGHADFHHADNTFFSMIASCQAR